MRDQGIGLSAVPDGPGGDTSRTDAAPPPAPLGRDADGAHLAELVARSSRGHDDAFSELYDLTASRIYGLVLRVLRSADHAAEVTQEVFVEVWRQSARYAPDKGSVLAWMSTIAHRRAVDRVRSVSSEVARDEHYAVTAVDREADHVWEDVEQRMDIDRVRRGMASLTPIQREAVGLAYFGGYTQTQVAALLKLPLGTVKTRIRDGLIGLRDALGVEA